MTQFFAAQFPNYEAQYTPYYYAKCSKYLKITKVEPVRQNIGHI